jgi:hypothetical protein
MWQVVRKQLRLNTSVNFFSVDQHTSPETKQYMYNTYVATGKQLMMEKEMSDDGLTLTVTQIWQNNEDYLECKNDPVSITMKEEFDAYIQSNGIIFEVVESEL